MIMHWRVWALLALFVISLASIVYLVDRGVEFEHPRRGFLRVMAFVAMFLAALGAILFRYNVETP